jgi:hypothetical protein
LFFFGTGFGRHEEQEKESLANEKKVRLQVSQRLSSERLLDDVELILL